MIEECFIEFKIKHFYNHLLFLTSFIFTRSFSTLYLPFLSLPYSGFTVFHDRFIADSVCVAGLADVVGDIGNAVDVDGICVVNLVDVDLRTGGVPKLIVKGYATPMVEPVPEAASIA